MNIPLLNLHREWMTIRKDVVRRWANVLDSMQLLNGPNLQQFESEMAEFLGVNHVIGVASGTDALTLALIAAGAGEGKNVIVAANTFAAAVEAIRLSGATPRLVDTRADDYGIDTDDLCRKVDRSTEAVIVTHMYGLAEDMFSILESLHGGITVIEDASHAHGAIYRRSRVGSMGKIGCFSCGPVKNLGCYGDGGFVSTDDDGIAEHVRLLGVHGQTPKNNHRVFGFNSRLDELQAAILSIKLELLDIRNAKRCAIARKYDEAFVGVGLHVIPTFEDRTCVYHQYVIQTDRRDELAAFLKERGVGTGVHYPIPLNLHPSWVRSYPEMKCPVAERTAKRILSLPVFPDMIEDEVRYVINAVVSFFK